jgi:hypothetical protein
MYVQGAGHKTGPCAATFNDPEGSHTTYRIYVL